MHTKKMEEIGLKFTDAMAIHKVKWNILVYTVSATSDFNIQHSEKVNI